MYRILEVTEQEKFKGCTTGTDGIKMRVAGNMSIKELRDRFGQFSACVKGQPVLLSSNNMICQIVDDDEVLSIFVHPAGKTERQVL